MADTKISALPAVTSPTDASEVPVNEGGTSKKVTLNQLTAYFEQRGRQTNASVANQTGFAADTYLTGSDVAIPSGRLQAKSMYRVRFNVTKTAAGTAAPVVNVRLGTAGTTADTSRATLTFGAQTALVDEGFVEAYVVFRTVGSGTTAVIQAVGFFQKELNTATGLGPTPNQHVTVTSAGFDSTVAGLRIGISVNGGTSAAWTVNLVQAELFNLA